MKYQVMYVAEKEINNNGEYGIYTEMKRIGRTALVIAESEEEMIAKIEAFHDGYKVVEYGFYNDEDFFYNYKIN